MNIPKYYIICDGKSVFSVNFLWKGCFYLTESDLWLRKRDRWKISYKMYLSSANSSLEFFRSVPIKVFLHV